MRTNPRILGFYEYHIRGQIDCLLSAVFRFFHHSDKDLHETESHKTLFRRLLFMYGTYLVNSIKLSVATVSPLKSLLTA
jgi:hypothetical protein